MEELGVTPEQVGLTRAGELVNDDGSSKRYIYTGRAALDSLKPSEEICRTELLTEESVPEGKNRGHMLSAVALSRTAWADENSELLVHSQWSESSIRRSTLSMRSSSR